MINYHTYKVNAFLAMGRVNSEYVRGLGSKQSS